MSREANQNNAKPDPCYVADYANLCPPGSCLWEVKPGSQKTSRRFSIMSLRTPRWGLGEDDPVKMALGDMLFIQPEDEPSLRLVLSQASKVCPGKGSPEMPPAGSSSMAGAGVSSPGLPVPCHGCALAKVPCSFLIMGAALLHASLGVSVPRTIARLLLQPEEQQDFYQQLQRKEGSREGFLSPTLRIFIWFATHCSDSCLIYSLFTSKSIPLKLMLSLKLQHVLIVLIILEIAPSLLLPVAILMALPWLPTASLLPGAGSRAMK